MTRIQLVILSSLSLIVLFFLFVFLFDISQKAPAWFTEKITPTEQIRYADKLPDEIDTAIVTRVVDGDTIEISGNTIIRYIGIDTPETVHPQKKIECFGKEASTYNTQLVLNKTVRLEKDVSETDRYGRLLRYVYVQDTGNTDNWIMVNESMVLDGYAYSVSYPPDIKYQEKLTYAEQVARENIRGLWSTCEER